MKNKITLRMVLDWCQTHDNECADVWLFYLLEGSITLEEFRKAVREDRAPEFVAEKARMDPDGTATPKTELVARVAENMECGVPGLGPQVVSYDLRSKR